jgi:hypothetical protein
LSKLGIFRLEFREATLEAGIHLKEVTLLKYHVHVGNSTVEAERENSVKNIMLDVENATFRG